MSNTTQLSKINEPISILRKIREELPDTVIGGGYFRDLYLDIPFNDIDIYVNAEPENSSMASEIYRSDFWKNKIVGNKLRDERNRSALIESGWRILTIWECALKGRTRRSVDEIISMTESWLLSDQSLMEISGAEEK